jgi:pyruvate formate-lyase activating enzyme-like uncharacterized protein
MRLTPYNFDQLTVRGYTFLHGEKVTVLESELCAFRIVRFGLEHNIPVPVNYCSFPYKRRFQHAAARRRSAMAICAANEKVTEPGYLRTFSSSGVRYSEAVLLQNPSYRYPFEKITLETGRALYLERRPVAPEIEMSDDEMTGLSDGLVPESVIRFEKIECGLAEYF